MCPSSSIAVKRLSGSLITAAEGGSVPFEILNVVFVLLRGLFDAKVPRLRRLPVRGFSYVNRVWYFPPASLRIIGVLYAVYQPLGEKRLRPKKR